MYLCMASALFHKILPNCYKTSFDIIEKNMVAPSFGRRHLTVGKRNFDEKDNIFTDITRSGPLHAAAFVRM